MAEPKRMVHIFVDNTNVFEEGKRASAIRLGKSAKHRDHEFAIDYGSLVLIVMDGGGVAAMPKMYGSEPPPSDSVWKRIRDEGYDLKVFKRNFRGKEKGLDMEMGLSVMDLIFEAKAKGEPPGTICLVAGDADYLPVLERIRQHGWKSEVWYWDNAAQVLKESADRFESLNAHIDFIGTRPKRKGRR